ncbi:hypothetical protein BpHYR1_039255, partial [Brachionus plicatilis]
MDNCPGRVQDPIDENVIMKLRNLDKLDSHDGYVQLINELKKIFQCSINKTNEPENAKNFKNFFERNQRPNETIVAFASSLKAFVRENFPKTDLETFEGIMKERFVEGLNNSRLREKFREKVKKSNRLQLEMSFDDLLTYAIDKFNGFDTNLETESDSAITNTKTVRFENSVAGENQQAMQKKWNNRLSLNGSNFQQNRHRYDTRYQARQTQFNNNPQDKSSKAPEGRGLLEGMLHYSLAVGERLPTFGEFLRDLGCGSPGVPSSCHRRGETYASTPPNYRSEQSVQADTYLGVGVQFDSPTWRGGEIPARPQKAGVFWRGCYNTLVSCYFDTGASCTVINESVYVRIKTEDPKTVLEPYTGKPIWSCNKKLTVYGQRDSLENVIIIITNHKSRYECLLGVDLMKKTPFFDKTISIMEKDKKSYSDKMTRLHENMSKNFQFKKPNRRSVEMIVDNRSEISSKSSKTEAQASYRIEKNKIEPSVKQTIDFKE